MTSKFTVFPRGLQTNLSDSIDVYVSASPLKPVVYIQSFLTLQATHLAPIFCLVNIAFAWPYTPKGGLGTNSTSSDSDFQSIVSLFPS